MDTKIERFFAFIMKEKIRSFFAFASYVSFIVMYMQTDLPLALKIVRFICEICISIFISYWFMSKLMDKMYESNRGKLRIQEIKKIGKEILMYIPILVISIYIISSVVVGQSVNQTSIEQALYEEPIFNLVLVIILGPIIEEFIFRFLPHMFIKNQALYIIVSSIVFAAMHVINDPNFFYYIWSYMIISLYYGYRYYKTKDILVTISIHSFNNLVATLLIFFL